MPSGLRLAFLPLALAAGAALAQALPPEIESALVATGLPRDAVTLLVAPVAADQPPRLAHRSDAPVNPASIAKLVTTYAGLELLGPAHAWRTSVYLEGPLRHGVLEGNVYLRGSGDPKLVTERLWLLMHRLQGLGVRQVTGDFVLDRSAFDAPLADAAAFDGEPLRPYNAQPDALLVNYKSVVITFTPLGAEARVQVEPPLAGVRWPASVPLDNGPCGDWRASLQADLAQPLRPRFAGSYPAACGERTWPLAFGDPASFSARAVAGMWESLGGRLGGSVREGQVPARLQPAFDSVSPPLAEVIRDINKYSNNVMAQQLFLTLGLQGRAVTSFPAARDAVSAWWRRRVGGEPPQLENGAGLSRSDRITAAQLARLLQVAWSSPLMPELVASLPIAGLDGTLRRSQRNTGVAHLKTGSLRDVTGVAGYVHGASGRRYVLVAIANHPRAAALRPLIEQLVEWTARD